MGGTSVNAGVSHLWVTDAPNATHDVMFGYDDDDYDNCDYEECELEGSRMSSRSDDDQDTLLKVSGHNLVYMMWGTKPNHEFTSNYVMEQLVRKIYYSFGKKLRLITKLSYEQSRNIIAFITYKNLNNHSISVYF